MCVLVHTLVAVSSFDNFLYLKIWYFYAVFCSWFRSRITMGSSQ